MTNKKMRHISSFILFFVILLEHVTMSRADEVNLQWIDQIPVIELQYEVLRADAYQPATLTYHSADSTCQFRCEVRHRGGTSLLRAKTSFALKFFDNEGKSLDVTFMGMRADNNWILNAMASDFGRVRNRFAFDLWLDASRKPYHQASEKKAVNGSRGHYVEVYVNGQYNGLYDLMERVDRKQLKLKKLKENADSTFTQRGMLYKATAYGRSTKFYYQASILPNDSVDAWDGYEASYPELDEGQPISWTPLRQNINALAYYNRKDIYSAMSPLFDVPVFIDALLFNSLLCATDNVGKNFYVWFYDYSSGDHRLGYTPWDLDAALGRIWNGDVCDVTKELAQDNFGQQMSKYCVGWADTLQTRYAELRATWFDHEALCQRLDGYYDLLCATGADLRERDRWNGLDGVSIDFDAERIFIKDWLAQRLAYLDGVYHYQADPTAIEAVKSAQDAEADGQRQRGLGLPRGFEVRDGRLRYCFSGDSSSR